MTSPENSNDETTTTVSLTITDLTLPDTEDQREVFQEDLEDALTTLLESKFDQTTVDVQARLGHWYASVSPTCPDCGDDLTIQGVHLGDGETAFALARCTDECGWTGDGVFALIDLDESVNADYESSVLSGTKTPDYHAYRDRDPRSTGQ